MELLSILASIAATMVGFTGLFTAFRASNDQLSVNDVTNIRILLIFSVSALVFALLPLPMLTSRLGDVAIRWLTGVLGAYLATWAVQSPLWMRRKRVKPRNPRLYWSMIAMLAGVGIALIAAALAGFQPMTVYSIGVLYCLLVAVVVFVVQIFVMLPLDRNP